MPRHWDLVPEDIVEFVRAYIPRPVQVALSSGRNMALLWKSDSGDLTRIFHDQAGRLVDIKFFPGGGRLATASSDGTLAIWSTEPQQLRHVLHGHAMGTDVYELQVFLDGDRFVSIGGDTSAVIWSSSLWGG